MPRKHRYPKNRKKRAYTPAPITPKQKAFATFFFEQGRTNAILAAKKAGFSAGSVKAYGSKLSRNPKVIEYMAQLERAADELARTQRVERRAEPAPREPDEVISPMIAAERNRRMLTVGDVEDAIASQAECLQKVSTIMRANLSDFFQPIQGGSLAANPQAIMDAPAGVLRKVDHDAAGDIRVEIESPLAAAKVLLEHYSNMRGGEDPMRTARDVMNVFIFQGTDQDRELLDQLSMRRAELEGRKAVPGEPLGRQRVAVRGGNNGGGR